MRCLSLSVTLRAKNAGCITAGTGLASTLNADSGTVTILSTRSVAGRASGDGMLRKPFAVRDRCTKAEKTSGVRNGTARTVTVSTLNDGSGTVTIPSLLSANVPGRGVGGEESALRTVLHERNTTW